MMVPPHILCASLLCDGEEGVWGMGMVWMGEAHMWLFPGQVTVARTTTLGLQGIKGEWCTESVGHHVLFHRPSFWMGM